MRVLSTFSLAFSQVLSGSLPFSFKSGSLPFSSKPVYDWQDTTGNQSALGVLHSQSVSFEGPT